MLRCHYITYPSFREKHSDLIDERWPAFFGELDTVIKLLLEIKLSELSERLTLTQLSTCLHPDRSCMPLHSNLDRLPRRPCSLPFDQSHKRWTPPSVSVKTIVRIESAS